MAAGKRWRRKALNCLGVPFSVRGAMSSCWTQKGTPSLGCMMPFVEGMRENSLQRVELLD